MHLRNLAWWRDYFSCKIKFEIELILLNILSLFLRDFVYGTCRLLCSLGLCSYTVFLELLLCSTIIILVTVGTYDPRQILVLTDNEALSHLFWQNFASGFSM